MSRQHPGDRASGRLDRRRSGVVWTRNRRCAGLQEISAADRTRCSREELGRVPLLQGAQSLGQRLKKIPGDGRVLLHERSKLPIGQPVANEVVLAVTVADRAPSSMSAISPK